MNQQSAIPGLIDESAAVVRGCEFYHGHAWHTEPEAAALRACEQVLRAAKGRSIDLLFAFVAPIGLGSAERAHAEIRRSLAPKHIVGCSAEGLIAGSLEAEGIPGVTVLAASLPGVRVHTFSDRDLPPIPDRVDPDVLAGLALGAGFDAEHRATFLFIDPFSVPLVRLMPALSAARRSPAKDAAPAPILGGLASGAKGPGEARLLMDDHVRGAGLVGVSLSGNIRVDTLLSQGCKPIGRPLVVTKARGNLILQLAGRPALDVVQEIVGELTDGERSRLHNSLVLGRVVNEYKDRFGRSDFLIRNLVGVEASQRGIAVSDIIKVGATVQFHLRDAETASRDLEMLLDAQRLHGPALGSLLITCNGRGTRLFDAPSHDASRVAKAFSRLHPGEQLAKAGENIDPDAPRFPLAGFFAAGEIGPLGDASYLHGQTACAAIFRAPNA